ACLGRLVAAAKQQHDLLAGLLVVDAIAGTVVDSHLANAFPNCPHVAGIPPFEPLNSCRDFRQSFGVSKFGEPQIELVGFSHLDHLYLIGYSPPWVKGT